MFTSVLNLLAGAAIAYAAQGQLQQVTNFGTNPNNVGMCEYFNLEISALCADEHVSDVYKPSKLASSPALVVAIHYCTGSAQAYFSGTQYANKADQLGFIVIYPDAPRSGKCFGL